MEERVLATGTRDRIDADALGHAFFGRGLGRNQWKARSAAGWMRARFGARSRALPGGLIGAVSLVLALECLIAPWARVADPRARLPLSWRRASRAASGPEGRAGILCFGDSLVKLGILPRVLEARLGPSAYNLAILGGQAPSSYFLLCRVLEQGHRPQGVVVDFSPLLLAMDPRVNAELWPALASRRELWELAWRTRDLELAVRMTVQDLMGAADWRSPVRMALGLDRQGVLEERSLPDNLRVFARNWRLNRGAQVAPRPFVPVEGALPQPYQGRNWRWRPYPAHAFYVERFLMLAQAHRIPVYWVLTPAMAAWRERNQRAGTTQAYRRFVQSHLSRFPGLTVLDGQHLAWDRRAFRDPIHLNRDGALRLSLLVAEAIASQGGGTARASRWMELDETQQPPPGRFQDLVEDLDQSRLAVNQRGTGDREREESRW
jgi:hypothetical protein